MGPAVTLTDTQECPLIFEQRVLLNVRYWHRYVADKTDDVTALDRERERIMRAISFGLDQKANWPDVSKLIRAYTHHMEIRGHWQSWIQLLNQALTTAQQAGDTDGVISLSVYLARLAQRQGQARQVASHYRRALRLARNSGNRLEEARACTNLGFLYIEQRKWQRTEFLCKHALRLFEQLDSEHGRAHTENHLGLLFTRQRQWDKARQHLEQACAIWQSMGDHHGLMYGFINQSVFYLDQENPERALHYLTEAQQLATQTGEESYLGKIHLNFGNAYRLLGEPLQAERETRQAERIFRRFLNLEELAKAWANLGLAYLDQRKWVEARQYLESSLEIRQKLNLHYDQIKSLISLIEYDLALKNRDLALNRLYSVKRIIEHHRYVELSYQLEILQSKYRHLLEESG